MKAIPAIKKYFDDGSEHGRKVTMDELRELSVPERQELGRLAAEALGHEFEPTSG